MALQVKREDVAKYQKEQREQQKNKELEEAHRGAYGIAEENHRPDPSGTMQTKVVVLSDGLCLVFHNDPNGFCFSSSLLKRVFVVGASFSFVDETLDLVVIPTITKGEEAMVEDVKVTKDGKRVPNGYKSSFNLVGRHDIKKISGIDSSRTVFECLFGEGTFKAIDDSIAEFKKLRDDITAEAEADFALKKAAIEERYAAKEPIGDLVDTQGEPLTKESVEKPNLTIVD